MKKYFFLGIGVGFILAGITFTGLNEFGKVKKDNYTALLNKESEKQEEIFKNDNNKEIISQTQQIETVEKNNPVPVQTHTEEKIVENVSVSKPVVEKEPEVPKVEEKKKSSSNKKNPSLSFPKLEDKPVTTTSQKEEYGKKIYNLELPGSTEPSSNKQNETSSNETIQKKTVSSGDKKYFVQLITTTSYNECERLFKRISEVELDAPKKGDKYIVQTKTGETKDGAQKIVEMIEKKYKIKGMVVKRK